MMKDTLKIRADIIFDVLILFIKYPFGIVFHSIRGANWYHIGFINNMKDVLITWDYGREI